MDVFNYIVTIHNKESILQRTFEGIALSSTSASRVYAVLDGCTDRSEQIVDELGRALRLNMEKITTPDVHEIRSLNAGLRRVTEGHVVCLQDDVVLQEPDLEAKVARLFDEDATLGLISPRHAMDIRKTPLIRQLRVSGLTPLIEEFNRVCRPPEALDRESFVDYGETAYRIVAGGSPLILRNDVWKRVGVFDEALAPYLWHDHEYSLSALKAGFRNALHPMRFVSKPEWSGMRQNPHSSYHQMFHRISIRNRRYIWRKHGDFLKDVLGHRGMSSEQDS